MSLAPINEGNLKSTLASLQGTAKERTVKTQNIEYDLETLSKKVRKGLIILDPDYQRRHRWDDITSSRLIESLILNIPIPVIYLSQDVDVDVDQEVGRYSVIDGQQRLTAIVRFFNNDFKLVGLEVLEPLNGSSYNDLPPFLKRRLEERTIRCLRIDSTIDPQVKYDIFERLNSGSVKLEAQELRNAAARGRFNDLIKKLSENADYRIMLQIDPSNPKDSKKVRKMLDVEYVLRYFALRRDRYKNFKKGFREFLTTSLEEMNRLDDSKLQELAENFALVVSRIRATFGDKAFAKYKVNEQGSLELISSFNASVYDALIVSVDAELNLGSALPTPLKEVWQNLFRNTSFFDSISTSVTDSSKVTTRIELTREAFRSWTHSSV